MLNPNYEMAERYLELLDDSAEFFTFQTFCDNKNKPKNVGDILARTLHGSFDSVKEELTELNRMGAGIFVCVNETDLKGIKKSNIVKVRSYFAEADSEPIGEFKLTPTFIVQSANGKHFYFVLREFTDSLNECEKVQGSIAEVHGTDRATKNMNRVLRMPGFWHQKNPDNPVLVTIVEESGEYHTEEDIKSYYPIKTPGRISKGINIKGIGKGDLKQEVVEFLKIPWMHGKDHNEFVHATANIKRNAYSQQECIDLLKAKGALSENKMNQIAAIYKSSEYIVNPYYKKSRSVTAADVILRSKIFKPALGSGLYVVDEELGEVQIMDNSAINFVLGKEAPSRISVAFTSYNPTINRYLFIEGGKQYLNLYNPPFWKKDNFFKGSEIEKCDKIPLEYDEFFNHLFGEYPESKEYVLDWIAYSLRNKNITVLSLVGTSRGIGKTSLAFIVKALHGESNFEKCKQSILDKEFNAQIDGKTFVNFDEAKILNDSALESIKSYTNGVASIERKGLDAITTKIYASIMLTNNSMESLYGVRADDDRQFSVPDITNQKLDDSYVKKCNSGISKIADLWEDEELLSRFARWLWYRDLTNYDPTRNFKSDHYYEVVRSSTLDWQTFILEDFRLKHLNTALPLFLVTKRIREEYHITVGISKMMLLCKDNRDKISIKRLGGKRWVLFAKENETEEDFTERLFKLTISDNQGFEFLKLANSLID